MTRDRHIAEIEENVVSGSSCSICEEEMAYDGSVCLAEALYDDGWRVVGVGQVICKPCRKKYKLRVAR